MGKWEDTEKRAEEVGGDSIFVRLANDKDTIVVAFVGDPEARELFWNQKEKKYEPYTAEHAKKKETITLRVLLNVVIVKQGNDTKLKDVDPPQVKVLEVNSATYRQVMKVRAKYGFEKCFFEICRNGEKGDTKTTYSVMSDEPMTDEDRAALAELELHDLEKVASKQSEDSGSDDGGSFDSYEQSKKKGGPDPEAPISAEDTAELIKVLKPLPREDLQKFLSRFGVKQIKALPNKDLEAAKKFCAELAAPAEPEEADPFA